MNADPIREEAERDKYEFFIRKANHLLRSRNHEAVCNCQECREAQTVRIAEELLDMVNDANEEIEKLKKDYQDVCDLKEKAEDIIRFYTRYEDCGIKAHGYFKEMIYEANIS